MSEVAVRYAAASDKAGGRSTSRRRLVSRAALATGLLILMTLWLGPLPQMSRTAFSPHMILHLAIVGLASPLIALGLSEFLRSPRSFRPALSWALLASFFEMVVVWGWHIPLLHAGAARSDALFVLQQISFLAAGLAVWTMGWTATSPAAAGAGAIAMFLTFMHMSMFGLVITLAPRLIYAPDVCRGAFGLTGFEDQQLGGILMAVFGGLPYLLGTVLACFRVVSAREASHSLERDG